VRLSFGVVIGTRRGQSQEIFIIRKLIKLSPYGDELLDRISGLLEERHARKVLRVWLRQQR